jgi:hypothetical protein
MGPDNQGHVRYPLYNASKNETLKKIEERGKTSWEKLSLKVQCIKNEEGTKPIAKQLCPSLQDNHAGSGTYA